MSSAVKNEEAMTRSPSYFHPMNLIQAKNPRPPTFLRKRSEFFSSLLDAHVEKPSLSNEHVAATAYELA